jgi:hypothetical protein
MLLLTNLKILSKGKNGRELHKSPELLPSKDKKRFPRFIDHI